MLIKEIKESLNKQRKISFFFIFYLRQQKFILSQFWRLESEIEKSIGLIPFWRFSGRIYSLFSSQLCSQWQSLAFFGLQTHYSNLCLCVVTWHPHLCVSVSKFSLLYEEARPVIGLGFMITSAKTLFPAKITFIGFRVKISVCLFEGHNSIHNIIPYF